MFSKQLTLFVTKMVYNEKEKVASKIDSVAEILPGKENARIKVRVIRMWKVPAFINPSESSSLQLVLIDEKVRLFYYNELYLCCC
jgi:hypothetical protein